MKKEEVKKAVELAEKELKEKRINKVKEIVKRTLEAIDKEDGIIKGATERRRILKMDLDDLKQGRLDRIEERQKKDPKAEKVSVVKVIKEIIREREVPVYPIPYWYQPYRLEWNPPYDPNRFYCSTDDVVTMTDSANNLTFATEANGITIDCSVAKNYSAGTYNIDGQIINFR